MTSDQFKTAMDKAFAGMDFFADTETFRAECENAINIYNISPENVLNVDYYQSGGGCIHLFISLSNGQKIGMHQSTGDITVVTDNKEMDLEWIENFFDLEDDSMKVDSLESPSPSFLD